MQPSKTDACFTLDARRVLHAPRKRWDAETASATNESSTELSNPTLSSSSSSLVSCTSSAIASFTPTQPTLSTSSSNPFLTTSMSSDPPPLTLSPRQTLYPRTVMTSMPETLMFPSTTVTTYSLSVLHTATPIAFVANVQSVCIGSGLDASVDGLLAVIVLPTAIGFLLWLLFAIIRPRFRQIFGLREWFVRQDLRPRPLQPTLWAFLFPHVQLIPSLPQDMSIAGKSPVTDAQLFPSDEQLSQRTLWQCFLLVSGWSVLGLAGALPIYMVSTPCIQQSAGQPRFTGFYSTLQDLSLLRLLRHLDSENASSSSSLVQVRAAANETDLTWNTRVRIIILTVLLIALGLAPSLWKIIHEFNKLVAFRQRWIDVHLQGFEMGWLGAHDAPGFSGWGEKRVKGFINKAGLSSSLDNNSNGSGRNGRSRRNDSDVPLTNSEKAQLEVDIQVCFPDTQQLALLIEERDEILENLEIAETKYISSFRLTTPDPSIADLNPVPTSDTEGLSYISRPRALTASTVRQNVLMHAISSLLTFPPLFHHFSQATARRRRARNPAYASSSLTPTSYVAPSQYYKLGSLRGVNGGRLADEEQGGPSFTDSVNQRLVGTRFQEVHHNLGVYGRLPLGSLMQLEHGVVSPVPTSEPSPSFLDPRRYGPNYVEASGDTEGDARSQLGTDGIDEREEWVDVAHEPPIDFSKDESPPVRRSLVQTPEVDEIRTSKFGRRPKIFGPSPSDGMDMFPPRRRGETSRASDLPPPHLRLQSQPPFVRPVTGLDHDDLGIVYADIRSWRTKLKSINQEIAEAQADAYNDIADGVRIKGWLMVGRGLSYIPAVQLIEGRAKEDVRWDELQVEGQWWNQVAFWTIVGMVGFLLAIGLMAVAGLAVATSPDFAHYFPFFQSLANHNDFATGLATVFAPSMAAVLFIVIAVAIVQFSSRLFRTVSVSANQLVIFKTVFYLFGAIASIWLIAAGAVLFAFDALSTSTRRTQTISDGAIYISVLLLAIVINVAIISPALLMLQPFRLHRALRMEKEAVTPRQRFRAVYPRTYNPLFAMGCCVLAVIFASAFSMIFPLIGPAVAILLLLTLIDSPSLPDWIRLRTDALTDGWPAAVVVAEAVRYRSGIAAPALGLDLA
ncbi:hypothetical protein EW146_g7167 [Bondarzewia mesenterica]|uniref:CSC1/OSCA1-like 7TM region domain-containing protein n=1 Tax=Bondarzewia mesenterica TaxID=1095465 RepID=A0A4S4LS76_9AGAM|nr:hypothetical protein EW146_g7167 [Bondarzewia mesenterica]